MKKKISTLALVFISFVFIVACVNTPPATPTESPEPIETLNPVAVFALTEIVLVSTKAQETIVALGDMATAASYTLTPTPEPLNAEEIKKLLNKSIDLNYAFGIGCSVEKVEARPDTGNNVYEHIIIKMKCAGEENERLAPERAFVDVITACKDNGHEVADIISKHNIQYFQLWILESNSGDYPQIIFDSSWADVQSLLDNKITADEFRAKVFSFTPPTPVP